MLMVRFINAYADSIGHDVFYVIHVTIEWH